MLEKSRKPPKGNSMSRYHSNSFPNGFTTGWFVLRQVDPSLFYLQMPGRTQVGGFIAENPASCGLLTVLAFTPNMGWDPNTLHNGTRKPCLPTFLSLHRPTRTHSAYVYCAPLCSMPMRGTSEMQRQVCLDSCQHLS